MQISTKEKEQAIFENKYWIPVTYLCNNNCIFCLMDIKSKTHHRTFEEIKNELGKVEDKENTRLVISGGEPTTHPNILDIISYAKSLGFKRIQIITNGRMFAYKDFTDRIISAGIGEVTFSIHGYTPELHDSLTRSRGSFKQVMKGVKNVLSHRSVIVNADIVITKQNSMYLEEIVNFLMDNGIMELNLHSITPTGNAYDNMDEIDYDFDKVAPYIHKAIDACKKRNAVLWMSRFPPQYLYGYEDFIVDSYKILEQDLEHQINNFQNQAEPLCKGKRCKYCSINIFCSQIRSINKATIKKENIDTVKLDVQELDLNQAKKKIDISRQFKPKKIIFTNVTPFISDIISYAKTKGFKKIEVITDNSINVNKLVECGLTNLRIRMKDKFIQKIISRMNDKIKLTTEIIISKQNFKNLESLAKRISNLNCSEIIFRFVEPGIMLYEDYYPFVQDLEDITPMLQKAVDVVKNKTRIKIIDISPCFLIGNYRKFVTAEKYLNVNDLTENGILDVLKFSRKNIHKVKIKGLQCRECIFDKNCEGIFKKYIRLFGFNSLVPVKE